MLDETMIDAARGIPIESVLAKHGVKLLGRVEQCGPCPMCGGTDRFAINARKQLFNCRRCGVGGDAIALVQFLDGVDFKTAVETLVGREAKQKAPPQDHDAVEAQRIGQEGL